MEISPGSFPNQGILSPKRNKTPKWTTKTQMKINIYPYLSKINLRFFYYKIVLHTAFKRNKVTRLDFIRFYVFTKV